MNKFLVFIALFTMVTVTSQNKVKIFVFDVYLEPFTGASIKTSKGVFKTDENGEVSIKFAKFPQEIKIFYQGYQPENVTIQKPEELNVILKMKSSIDQIIVSASRIPERIIESPVALELLTETDFKNSSNSSFFGALSNMKGVDYRPMAYGYSTINTRGFSSLNNPRFIQLLDGVDMSLPSINIAEGNLAGVSELDLESIEVLYGASSALYGANAYNGLMLLKTKNPFEYQGVSAMIKSGVTLQKTGSTPYYDVSVRLGYKFSENFAIKVNFGNYTADEWTANDFRNRDLDNKTIKEQTTIKDASYDALNMYGDGDYVAKRIERPDLGRDLDGKIKLENLYRTGYTERELVTDSKVKNVKFSTGLYFRPIKNSSLQVELSSNLSLLDNSSMGPTGSRTIRRNFYQERDKFEISNENFYIRTYLSRVVSDKLYGLEELGKNMNLALPESSNALWADSFINAYGKGDKGVSIYDARLQADKLRPQPNTTLFNSLLDKFQNTLVTEGGSGIYDRSKFVHSEGNYNFKKFTNNWMDIQVGGSYRKYLPKTNGTILNEAEREISIEEYGFYTQIQKKILEDRLKITGSVRYDKSSNFDANFSPRFTLNYVLGEDKNHVFRASYQTAFRNPTLNEQYLFVKSGRIDMVAGTTEDNLKRISFEETNDLRETYKIDGIRILDNAYDMDKFYKNNYTEPFTKATIKPIKPETNQTVEFGYRSLLTVSNNSTLDVDFSAFYTNHKGLIYEGGVVVPGAGKIYPYGNNKLTDIQMADTEKHIKNELIRGLQKYFKNEKGKIVDYYGNTKDDKDFKDLIDNRAFSIYRNRYIRDGILIADKDAIGQLLYNGFKKIKILTNYKPVIHSYGFGIGLGTNFLNNYHLKLSYNYMNFNYKDDGVGFEPNFNTPNHMAKMQIYNPNVFENIGFSIAGSYLSSYNWVGSAVRGHVDARTVVDAQLSYTVSSIKSTFKMGATNLLAKEYFVAPGMGKIGSTFNVSWLINQ